MTVTKMRTIWAWFAARMADPPLPPRMRIGGLFTQRWAGQYLLGTVTVRPWADRIVVLHEYAHHYWHTNGIAGTLQGYQFLVACGLAGWGREAKEMWAATLTAVLTGCWGRTICTVKPQRQAAWTFAPLLREKAGT